MEKLMYESRPYAFLILGVVAVMSKSPYPKYAIFCSAILVACSTAILYWRHSNRTVAPQKRHHN